MELSARPWSKLIDRKFLKMNIASIEVLLRVVHHSLVKKYEENVLQRNDEMRTISQICEECKKVSSEQKNLLMWRNRINGIASLVVAALVIYTATLTFGTITIVLLNLILLVMILAFVFITFGARKSRKYDETQLKLEPCLEQFREAVHALIPQEVGLGVYSETAIRKGLQMLALEVVAAEKVLDDVRLEKVRLFTAIKFYCDRVEKGQNQLNSAIAAAEKFGVTVNKAELFKAAEKRIKQDSK